MLSKVVKYLLRTVGLLNLLSERKATPDESEEGEVEDELATPPSMTNSQPATPKKVSRAMGFSDKELQTRNRITTGTRYLSYWFSLNLLHVC